MASGLVLRQPVDLKPFVPAFRAMLQSRVREYAQRVETRVQANLSGGVLQRRSGRLFAHTSVTVAVSGLVMTITGRADAPYAAIQEQGGPIPPHLVRPVRASVLHFFLKAGDEVFTRLARIPAITLRPRPYLGPAFPGEVPWLEQALAADAARLVRALGR